MRKNIFLTTFLTTMIVLALLMGSQLNASAAKMLAPSGGDISIDFVAAGPFSYDRTTGIGGQYDGRIIDKNTGVVESLEGGDLDCGDIIVFFDAITVGNASTGASTIEVVNSSNKFTTSGGGVGFFTINSVTLQKTDPAYTGNKNETVSFVDVSTFRASPATSKESRPPKPG